MSLYIVCNLVVKAGPATRAWKLMTRFVKWSVALAANVGSFTFVIIIFPSAWPFSALIKDDSCLLVT